MTEVHPNLYVGTSADCKDFDGAILHACKEPYHRQMVGYKAVALPKDHEHYLWIIKGNEMALNIIDADKPEYFADSMIDTALEFIDHHRFMNEKVLVHCNQGQSRSPSIAMLYMRKQLPDDFEQAEEQFREIYPAYSPKNGIREYIKGRWNK